MSDCREQTVASTSNTLVLSDDDPGTTDDEGRSFVVVSGLGGKSIRDQKRNGPWWASIYTSDQDANHGALFGTFHYDGDPRLAYFYFKDIDGFVADEFFVRSSLAVRAGSAPIPVATTVPLPGSTTTTTEPAPGATSTTITSTTTTTMVSPDRPANLCGDADDDGGLSASDALLIAKTAIGLGRCAMALCDVNGDGSVTIADVIDTLRAATGIPVSLSCPPLSG